MVLRLQNKTDNIEELYSEKCEREKTKSDKSNYTPKSRVIMNTRVCASDWITMYKYGLGIKKTILRKERKKKKSFYTC